MFPLLHLAHAGMDWDSSPYLLPFGGGNADSPTYPQSRHLTFIVSHRIDNHVSIKMAFFAALNLRNR